MRASSLSSRTIARACLLLALLALALPSAAAAEVVYHVLAKGETLYSVARVYGISPIALAAANSIDDPEHLLPGTKLVIPGQAKAQGASSSEQTLTYKVVKGDTLFSIAKTYGVSVEALRSANKLKSSSVIKPGNLLSLPSGAKAPASATVVPAPPSKSPTEGPAMPEPVKTSPKTVNKGIVWPCSGDMHYLDGKAYGVLIKSKVGEVQKAVAAGTVSSAGPYRGYGNVVFVASRTGHIYVYGGNESLSVRAGDKVVAGQELGKIGIDNKQGGAAAYFFVFKDGEAVDPAQAPRS
jgi:murein DD-endopeptidase MepM/ murein hydrolase activator NlpD